MAEAQQQRYRVIDRLAAGGMAEVFRAESAGLEGFKKKVAIKRVLPHLSEKKKFIKMFLDEARLGAYLSHSNCVQVFDIGVGDNTYFIVMEYVDGADLKAVIEWVRKQNRSFPTAFAVYITTKICEGLAYAHNLTDEHGHDLGIVHRDLSPPNVLITKYGEIKIVDFGLAKASSSLEKSEKGIIKGKFSYLSPEAATGKEVDARTDIYAAGIILWEMLGGRKLFQGETDFETVKMVQRSEIPSISRINPTVDPQLEAIINKSLTRDPEVRFQTARDMARALTEWLFASKNAVTAFDIAELVQSVTRDRRKERGIESSKAIDIGSLIQQTLFEFTSLQEDTDEGGSKQGNKPIDASSGPTVDIQDWGSELGLDGGSSFGNPAPNPAPKNRPTAPSLAEGNLSALEEDPPAKVSIVNAPPAASAAASADPAPPAATTAPAATTDLAKPGDKKPPTGIIAALLVAIVVLGGAGAYAMGLFGK